MSSGSRTVLRERGGAIPPRNSPTLERQCTRFARVGVDVAPQTLVLLLLSAHEYSPWTSSRN
jgi:hypothetical protein